MLLTVATTHVPATDLSHLLHKHPGRVQAFTESMGVAHVLSPEATAERCTATLLLEVDPSPPLPTSSRPPGGSTSTRPTALRVYVDPRS